MPSATILLWTLVIQLATPGPPVVVTHIASEADCKAAAQLLMNQWQAAGWAKDHMTYACIPTRPLVKP